MGIKISTTQLAAIKDCGERKMRLSSLHLREDVTDTSADLKTDLRYAIVEVISGSIGVSDALDGVLVKERPALSEGFLAEQKIVSLDRLFAIYSRLCNYLLGYVDGARVIGTHLTYSYPLNVRYRGVDIGEVTCSIDVLLERGENSLEAILIKSGAPVSSYAARIDKNRPENNLFITSALMALKTAFPEKDITVSLFHLKSKDDKGNVLADYEGKRGKNIISVSYSRDVDAMQELSRSVTFSVSGDCDDCSYADVCTFKTCIRTVDKAEVVEKPSVNKPIKYSDAQTEVINHVDGPMLVEAVPGAGKTFSLVQRLLAMRSAGINMQNIVMITFTKKAAGELRERVGSALGEGAVLPVIETFNGFGYSILRDNPSLIGGNVRLAAEVDKKSLIEKAIIFTADAGTRIAGVNYDYLRGDYGLIDTLYKYFTYIEDNGEDLFISTYSDKKDTDGMLSVYHKYREMYQAGNYIDYDDQINLVNRMFKNYPNVLKLYQSIYKYIMVDEFQDVNAEQFELIQHLVSGEHCNLVCVGDSDQAIYGYRGGSSEYALNFCSYFPGAKVVMMTDNYRCTSSIVSAANALIKVNTARYDKAIVAHKDGAPAYLYRSLPGGGVVKLVNNLLTRYQPGEIAIIARNNKTLKNVGLVIDDTGNLTPKDYIIEDCVFTTILDLLSLYYGGFSNNEKALYRLLVIGGGKPESIVRSGDTFVLKPSRWLDTGSGPSDYITLHGDASLYDSLVVNRLIPSLSDVFAPDGDGELWGAGVKILNCINSFKFFTTIADSLNRLVSVFFGIDVHLVVSVLADMADERGIDDLYGLYLLMKDMVAYKDMTRVGYPPSADSINLLTAHDSKGKEFPCVILYGVDEFAPSEEERRLLYVALTRAKETLVIVQNAISENMVPEFSHCCRELAMK